MIQSSCDIIVRAKLVTNIRVAQWMRWRRASELLRRSVSMWLVVTSETEDNVVCLDIPCALMPQGKGPRYLRRRKLGRVRVRISGTDPVKSYSRGRSM